MIYIYIYCEYGYGDCRRIGDSSGDDGGDCGDSDDDLDGDNEDDGDDDLYHNVVDGVDVYDSDKCFR